MKKSKFKKIKIALITICITIAILFCYAFLIEPYRLQVQQFSINEANQTTSITVVQFSDVHIKHNFTYQNLSNVVSKINEQDPDIVVFTGDLYDNYATYNDDKHIINELQKINSSYAKIAIWGNHDYGGGAAHHYESIMEQSGFILLKNQNYSITTSNGTRIGFTGIDDTLLGNPHLPPLDSIIDHDIQIFLTHEPDIIDSFPSLPHTLLLSGHSHGGQIHIPLIPFVNRFAVQTTNFASTYSSGSYDYSSSQLLYVNTGIGTTHISARFGVVPEIVVFHIYPPSKN